MKLILIRGIPGSGKSTLANQISKGEDFYHILEADQYFLDSDGKYNFDANKLHLAHKWCQDRTELYISNFMNVIVSNTFVKLKELKPYFKIAKKYNIKPTVITVHGNFKSIHNVPEETIERMKRNFVYDISKLYKEFYE